MSSNGNLSSARILVVRLGAMGDVVHALPAVASLKHSLPGARISWVVEPRWAALLEGNPYVDRVVLFNRRSLEGIAGCWRELRSEGYDLVVDFQGLIKSALVARCAGGGEIIGFHPSQIRERAAGLFYSKRVATTSVHLVDQNLELASVAGARNALRVFPLPEGRAEGELPAGDFVLASPLAGWRSKQWPIEHYAALQRQLDIPLVLNLPPNASAPECPGAVIHRSSIAGLIHATRRAAAVVGVDSGPLHLAAALGKPGVAIFGPTDPARNGPYGDSLAVLRSSVAPTTYRRGSDIDLSMQSISPDQVLEALRKCPV